MKRTPLFVIPTIIIVVFFLSTSACASPSLLVLYKSSEGCTAKQNIFASYLQSFAESEGYTVIYHDIEEGLPSEELMQDIQAIVTVYWGPVLHNAREYIHWLTAQLHHRKKVIVMNNFGASSPDGEIWYDNSVLNEFYHALGLDFAGNWTNDPGLITVVSKDPEMVEFETRITPQVLTHYFTIKSIAPGNEVFLSLTRTDLEDSESHVIVKTPVGGLAMEDYVLTRVGDELKRLLNLEQFLAECLREPFPEEGLSWLQEAQSEEQEVGSEGLPKILVLYKDRDVNHEAIVNYLGGFLTQAGYAWETMDIETLLFEQEQHDLSQYHGLMSCYLSSQMVGGDMYPQFLVEQMEAGRKIVIIGSYGAYQGLIPKPDGSFIEWNESTQTINTFFWPFGLEFLFGWTNKPDTLRVTHKDPAMVEYEAELTPEDVNYYQYYKSVNPTNTVYLEVERQDMLDSKSAFVVHTPFGGMLLEGYGYFWSLDDQAMRQRVDLVRFIQEAFAGGCPEVPHYNILTHEELLEKYPLPQVQPPAEQWDKIPGEIKRHVLVLYKGDEAATVDDTPIFNRAGLILNHLGLIVDYWNLDDGLPSPEQMKKYRGIITWHHTPFMEDGQRYGEWLLQRIRAGQKVVIFQDYGAEVFSHEQTAVDNVWRVFQALGIEYKKLKLARAEYYPEILTLDEGMMGFEWPAEQEYFEYAHKYVSANPKNKVYLSLKDPYSGQIDLVVTTPKGGIAMGNSAFYFPPGDAERIERIREAFRGELQPEIAEENTLGAWIVNPYLFFTEALDLDELPAPDYTTLNGSRMYYIHIDGDALSSVSLIDKAHFAGKHVLEKHLRPYRDIPFSPSIISRQLETSGNRYYSPLVELSREIFSLPNVEVASHTTTHPFDWVAGDPYITNPGEYPWKIGRRQQDFVYEIWGTKLFIDYNLAPEGKELQLLLWSGECNPDERALRVAYAAGLKNMNGGDPIYDDEHPYLSGLCPLSLQFDGYRQFHTSAQNDYIYTLYLTGDWGGQRKVINHFEKSESPRRILPMNLYYHFYGGIKEESLEACEVAFEYFRKGNYAGVFGSEYVSIAEDFFNTHVWKEGKAFRVENNGFLRTLRFKDEVFPDLEKSEGVIGYLQYQGQTYIHLLGTQRRKIVLSSTPPHIPYLRQGTYWVDKFATGKDSLSLTMRGFGKAYLEFGGLAPSSAYTIQIDNAVGNEVVSEQIMSDTQGRLNLTRMFPAPRAIYQLHLTREGGL